MNLKASFDNLQRTCDHSPNRSTYSSIELDITYTYTSELTLQQQR